MDNLNGVEPPVVDHFHVDLTPPSAFSLTSPAAGFVGPAASVSATAFDPGGSGIAQLEFRYCPGATCSFSRARRSARPSRHQERPRKAWDLSGLTDGAPYTVVARATDAAGNTTDSAQTTVTLDKTAPATSDNAPAGSQSSDVTVTLAPGDGSGSGVASTSYRVDGGGWAARHERPHPRSCRPLERRLSHDRLRLGRQRRQRRGRSAGERHHRHPVAERLTPRSGLGPVGTVALSDPTPGDSGAGVASVAFQYSLHGANTWTTIGTALSAPWSVSFDTTAVADGQYDIRELISDAASPANVTTIDLAGPKTIDNSPPSSAAVTAPASGAHVAGTVALTGTASDATSGVGQMTFKVNGTVVGTSAGSPASVNWDSTSTPGLDRRR